ncbi:Glycosyltransferase involved in cell wall bisynthesis [Halobacillus alkaliphilus]|uniref:Glycosyltransferase involved in cell wall bisynthesis n=1 Tax=Halobacillus alkaliphilus TaxID=396056 RepID=A0A1I2K0Q7_9BACI|nr:glycosyltransferase [Halobacillus alkaliphilus]SFF58671.1 Glycosyltransferase involved in cell wall bisynthesis [Halobacillus alkaliphilus]
MKVIQVNAVYPSGSTGKIVKDLHTQLLENGHESIICYGRGGRVNDQNVHKTAPELVMKMQSLRSKITGYAYGGSLYSTLSLKKIINKENPDIVHLHCINSYMVNIYKLLKFLKKNKIKTVLTLHAEFMYTAGCAHALDCEKWKSGCGSCPQKNSGRPSSKIFDRSADEWVLMKEAFEGFDNLIITSVSKWLHDRAIQSPFFLDKEMKVVLNGIDTENTFKLVDATKLKKRFEINGEKIVLHVTPSFNQPIKGGKNVIKLAKALENENIRFFIVGFDGDADNLPKNVTAISRTNNQRDLAMFYSLADVTLLTSEKETFSMVCAESLACGTPVVGFKAGAPETISLNEYSEFVEQGNIKELEKTIKKWLFKKESDPIDISSKAQEVYSKKLMYEQYLKLYKA